MREPSSPSVKVTFTNREQILKALENLIQEWTQHHPELEQVILFGSLGRTVKVVSPVWRRGSLPVARYVCGRKPHPR